MPVQSLDRHIVIDPGISGGKPRIAGHRITVENIAIWYLRMGKSPEEIAGEYGLGLADVHAALAYCFDNREVIDRRTEEDDAFVETLRNSTPSALERKLKNLRGE